MNPLRWLKFKLNTWRFDRRLRRSFEELYEEDAEFRALWDRINE